MWSHLKVRLPGLTKQANGEVIKASGNDQQFGIADDILGSDWMVGKEGRLADRQTGATVSEVVES